MSSSAVPIDFIWVDRATRQRRDLGDLTDLMSSIDRIGLINLPVIQEDGKLIAGERRWESAKRLGWTHIEVRFKNDLSSQELEQIELDENIRRLDLSWQDKALAYQRYHEIAKATSDNSETWTYANTADSLGVWPTTVVDQCKVAEALKRNDKMVVEAPRFSVALGIIERAQARERDAELDEVDSIMEQTLQVPAKAAVTTPLQQEVKQAIKSDLLPLTPIINANFLEWAKVWSGPKFNLLHCDFPYGVDANKHDQGAASSFGGYEDSEEVYDELLAGLSAAMGNIVAPAAHMLFWYAAKTYTKTYEALTSMGWTVNPVPLIWFRSDNSGVLPDPKRGPRQVYETAFLCSRGDRFIVRAKSNVVASPNTKNLHMSEKPVPVLTHFLSMLVDQSTTMLDPTCGSGNALVVGRKLNAKLVVGIEKDPEFHATAERNWRNNNAQEDNASEDNSGEDEAEDDEEAQGS